MALGSCALDAKAMNVCCGLVTTDAYILILLFATWSDYMVARKCEFRCEKKPHTGFKVKLLPDSTETQKTAVLSLFYDLGWLYGFFVNERGSEIELAIETKKSYFGPAPATACTTATGISYRCEVDIVVRANASFSWRGDIEGFACNTPRLLNPRDTQRFNFEIWDPGSYYHQTVAKRKKTRQDTPTGRLSH